MPNAKRPSPPTPELRTKILAASQHIFATEGFEALSMRRVAKEIGYSATTLYLYFENREEIVSELGREGLARLGEVFRRVPETSDPLVLLSAYATAYVDFAQANPDVYRLIFMENSRLAELIFRPGKSTAAADEGAQVFALLVTPFERLRARQKDWAMIDPLRCAEVFWTTLHGIVALKLTCGKFLQTPVSDLVDLALPALLAGLPRVRP